MARKTALVTGAARGIGLATSRLFVERGWQVAMIDRDVSQALMHSMLRHPLAALEQRSSSQWLQLFRDVSAMRSGMSLKKGATSTSIPAAA